MKVLWFSGSSALYAENTPYCGWVGALQKAMANVSELQLFIVVPWQNNFKEQRDKVVYYGAKIYKYQFINYKRKQAKQLCRMREIIEDVRPDIIHVFGSENEYGLVSKITQVPVVLHIQGIMGACFEGFLPYNLSWRDYLLSFPIAYVAYKAWRKFVVREREIFKHCNCFMGRTDWDKSLTYLLAPQAKYYHCDEIMREEFYESQAWKCEKKACCVLVSIISSPMYKGVDVILRTAALLKEGNKLDFKWKVFGVSDIRWAERLTGIKACDVGVELMGVVDSMTLVMHMQEADMYVHPSYVENSSNAICEAQCVGMPVVATNVGGTSTLVDDGKTGILVPPNDIYKLAAQILTMEDNPSIRATLGANARKVAIKRHAPQQIVSNVLAIYKSIIKDSDNRSNTNR